MRSKAEVFQEHFNVRMCEEAREIEQANSESGPRLPISSYTKLTLPYEASSHPGIPTFEEIAMGMKNNKISDPMGLREVCRVGNTVVKVGWDQTILQVSDFDFICLTHMANQD